ncbi:unnamed protein product [Hymenolepis diminuta]|uniref:Uncharacterized protein n=1 Tax=Hymenolepis diminuta TaxID=6216 RepID=A0A564YWE8_HYMDI|nr:unnamed protein product [Hymenolepis diminuta]
MASVVKFSFPPFPLPLDPFLAVTSPAHPRQLYSSLPTMRLWLLPKSTLFSESPRSPLPQTALPSSQSPTTLQTQLSLQTPNMVEVH